MITQDVAERKMRFTVMYPAKDIILRIEETVRGMGFGVQNRNGKVFSYILSHIKLLDPGLPRLQQRFKLKN